MSEFKIASRYTKALFDKAIEIDALEMVYSDIKNILHACQNSDDLMIFLQSPLLKKSAKKEALSKIFASCSELPKQLMLLMTDKNRESFIPLMTSSFVELYNKHNGITTAVVTSAFALNENALVAVNQYVKSTSGANEVQLTQAIDASVIGGMNIVFDGKIYDATLSNQILKLKKDLQIA